MIANLLRILLFILISATCSVYAQQQTSKPASIQQQAPPKPQPGTPNQPPKPLTQTTNAPAAPSPDQIPLEQFEAWLKSNGYDNGGNGVSTAAPAPTNAPSNQAMRAQQPMPLTTPKRPKRLHRPPTFEENQSIMVNSAPPTPLPPTPESNIAFNAMLQQSVPMAPTQIVQLRQQVDVSQRAAAIPPNIPPKPVSTTIMINLAPGTTPPAIRLAQGYVSSLVFVDSTGAPWPIAAFDIGNPKAVNIQWDGKSNILLLQAVLAYSDGDIVVRLVGLPTPITLELVAGQRVVDYRVDLHVSGIGPNAKEIPLGVNLPTGANQVLLSVLDGIAPPGSRVLNVRGAEAQAWILGEVLFLRTRFTVLSPGWMSTMVSPDGMHAYELPRTSSVLVSRYGEPVELRVEGF